MEKDKTSLELAEEIERTHPDVAELIRSMQERIDQFEELHGATIERCAVQAWMSGMDAHSRARGLPTDAREVGSLAAQEIRKIYAPAEEKVTARKPRP